MTRKTQRFLRVWITAAATAVICWVYVPTSPVDASAFMAFARINHGPEVKVSGHGSHTSPWQVQWNPDHADTKNRPVIITLHDDPNGFFQSSPHAPVDIAVILSNIQRLGARHLACAPLLAWENPDAIGLTALETQMDKFHSMVIAVPLARGAVLEPMPAAFRRASLPIEDIHGDIQGLPVINRASIPNLIYGNDNTLAGFQILDSEPPGDAIPLLARWDYRIVLAFPLLAAMQQLELRPEDLTIHVGESIRLGKQGPVVPIDEFGRLDKTTNSNPKLLEIRAEALIDGQPDLFKNHTFSAPIICDHRSINESAITSFNRTLTSTIMSITSGQSSQIRNFPRLKPSQEIYMLLALTVLLALATPLPFMPRLLLHIAVTCACLLIQYTVLSYTHHWLPGIPGLAAIAAALVISSLPRKKGPTAYLNPKDGLSYVRYPQS